MGMTAEILEARRSHLGASETPVVLGYGQYAGSTPDRVYWNKVGPQPLDTDTPATAMGNDLEPALVQYAQRTLGETFITDPAECFQVMLEGLGEGILSATPDGILIRHVNGSARRWGLECKAVMYGNPAIYQWGDPAAVPDKVPDDVIIQTQQQMAVWNLDVVWVPVLWCVGYRPEFRMYRVERDGELWDQAIAPQAVNWWNEHIVTRIPPGREPPPMDVVKRLERRQGYYVPADAETHALIVTWETCRQSRNQADNDGEHVLREVLSRLGDAEGFEMMDGRRFTYKEQNGQRRCDLDALKEKWPDAYEATVTQPTHRTPRVTGKARCVDA